LQALFEKNLKKILKQNFLQKNEKISAETGRYVQTQYDLLTWRNKCNKIKKMNLTGGRGRKYNMKIKKETQFYTGMCIILAAVIFVTLAWLWCASPLETPMIELGEASKLDSGWYYVGEGEEFPIALPYTASGNQGRFFHDLSDTEGIPEVICMNNGMQSISVFLDGREIFAFGEQKPLWGTVLPEIYCIVPLGILEGNHRLEVCVENGINNQIALSSVLIGSEGEVLVSMLKQFWEVIIFDVIMLSFSVLLIGLSMILLFRKRKDSFALFFHAGMFVLIVSIWVLTDAPVLQLSIQRGEFVFIASFLCFMLIPLPLLSFVESACNKKFGSLILCRYLIAANIFAQILLHAGFGVDMYRMLPVTHLLMAVAVLLVVGCLYKEVRESNSFYARGLLLAICIFVGVTGLALIDFYGKQEKYSRMLQLGTLVYSVTLVLISMRKMLYVEEENAKSELYKSLAFTDILTGCKNRTFFERDLEEYARERKCGQAVCLGIVDINGLKLINDSMGHKEGDRLIVGAAECIEKAFGNIGRVTRIGGDEFAILMPGCCETEEILRSRLEKVVCSYNTAENAQLSLAFGVAYCPADEVLDAEKLFMEADRRMYVEKKKSKQRMRI